jgi:hypothetical protein
MSEQLIRRDKKGRFLVGSVPNPKGRPKSGESIGEILSEFLKENYEDRDVSKKRALVEKMFELAMQGRESAMKLMLSYSDGIPTQKVEMSDESIKKTPEYQAVLGVFLDILSIHPDLEPILYQRLGDISAEFGDSEETVQVE